MADNVNLTDISSIYAYSGQITEELALSFLS
jgi:hypothetical protein